MSAYVLWFVIGFALLVAELLTGTFYLLVLAIASAAAGLAALAGASFALQLAVAAGIGLAGALWLRRRRAGSPKAAADAVQQLDVGQPLRIEHWSAGRTARASYRGAQWDVELAPGEEATPGEYVIREIQGSRLVVSARR